MKRKYGSISLIVALFSPLIATAVPSGLAGAPPGVKLPPYNGRTLPVGLYGDSHDPKLVHVTPNQGEFVSQGVVKSPLTDCDLVKEELKIAEINVKSRVLIAKFLFQAQEDHAKSQVAHNDFIIKNERALGIRTAAEADVKRLEAEKNEENLAIKSINSEIAGVKGEIAAETEEVTIAPLQKKMKGLEKDLQKKKREYAASNTKYRNAKNDLAEMDLQLGEISGILEGFNKTFKVQTDELIRLKSQISELQKESDEILTKYSGRLGGYTTYTADFAPAGYLQALRDENPGFQFQYVRSVTAVVDTTIPENIVPGSPLKAEHGSMILDAKWSGSGRKGDEQSLQATAADGTTTDPVGEAQKAVAERQSSLEGTKYLSLKLSVIGYCALKEPQAFKEHFVGGSVDTFKLSLHYTYPVNYAIRISGSYSSHAALHEFYKNATSNKWLGLSTKNKVEYMRTLATERLLDVKVDPIGYQLEPQDALLLTEKVKEQLLFFAIEPFLKKGGNVAPLKKPDVAQGASKVGTKLMLIPNPYAFWSGVVLDSLGGLFGKKSATQIRDMEETSKTVLNYETGFSFLYTGEITIGDLKQAQLIKEEE